MKVITDVECTSNFFCIVFAELDGEGIIAYEISSRRDDREYIIATILAYTLLAYNSHHYDDILMNYLIHNPDCTNHDLYLISKAIIDGDRDTIRPYKYNKPFDSIDVMTMIASSKLRVSLKHLQVVTNWHNVEEFECDWNKPLPEERWDDCIDYCKNDVLSLKHVCKLLKKDFELREFVQETTGIECRSKDPVKIAEYAMSEAIAKGLGYKSTDVFIRETVKSNTPFDKIEVKDLLYDFIEFKTPLFQEVLESYRNLTLYKGVEFKKRIRLGEIFIDFSLGGCHSSGPAKTHKPNKGEKIYQSDISGFYPSQRIDLKYPHRFDPWFYDEYAKTRVEKLEGKKTGNKLLEGYGKLKGNAVFGLLLSLYSPLYEPSLGYRTTIQGNLMMGMLIEKLHINKFVIIGANTDAVNVRVPDNRWEEYLTVCAEWEKETKMKLDHEEFTAIYESSVNHYIGVYSNGKIKTKGSFSTDLDLKKGFEHPITKIAIIKYFTENIPIEKTIRNHNNIYDFCMSTRMGYSKKTNSSFSAYWNNSKIQKTNRYYASKGKNSAYLYKSGDGIKMEHVLKDSGVTIFNKYIEKPMEEYNINYDFYEAKCRKIINEIEPEQLTLF